MITYINFFLAILFLFPGLFEEHANNSTLTLDAFDQQIEVLYEEIEGKGYGLDEEAWRYAMIGYYNLKSENKVRKEEIITVIDFNKASTEKRLFTVDLNEKKVLFHSLVSHGKNTGQNYASDFSNTSGSLKSSLGFYMTAETYYGKHGLSLRLDGMDESYNDNARERAIVIHGADYVNESIGDRIGRLGRSWGCPALPQGLHKKVINTIKEKSVLFIYYEDEKYLNESDYLNATSAIEYVSN